jgi:hypothetical protein
MQQEKENKTESTITVRRCMDLKEFCRVVPLCESEIRHNKRKYQHLMVKTPARRILFDAVKVSYAIQNGNLSKV